MKIEREILAALGAKAPWAAVPLVHAVICAQAGARFTAIEGGLGGAFALTSLLTSAWGDIASRRAVSGEGESGELWAAMWASVAPSLLLTLALALVGVAAGAGSAAWAALAAVAVASADNAAINVLLRFVRKGGGVGRLTALRNGWRSAGGNALGASLAAVAGAGEWSLLVGALVGVAGGWCTVLPYVVARVPYAPRLAHLPRLWEAGVRERVKSELATAGDLTLFNAAYAAAPVEAQAAWSALRRALKVAGYLAVPVGVAADRYIARGEGEELRRVIRAQAILALPAAALLAVAYTPAALWGSATLAIALAIAMFTGQDALYAYGQERAMARASVVGSAVSATLVVAALAGALEPSYALLAGSVIAGCGADAALTALALWRRR